jgi:hypothetical protein
MCVRVCVCVCADACVMCVPQKGKERGLEGEGKMGREINEGERNSK